MKTPEPAFLVIIWPDRVAVDMEAFPWALTPDAIRMEAIPGSALAEVTLTFYAKEVIRHAEYFYDKSGVVKP